jgi:hypothetical protein
MYTIASLWNLKQVSNNPLDLTKIAYLDRFNCFAGIDNTNGNYIYAMKLPSSTEIPEIKNSKFRGVNIQLLSDQVEHNLLIVLNDIEIKDVFILFIDDIINSISESPTEYEAYITTIGVISKWKKLFDRINNSCLSEDRVKGLLGELHVLKQIIIETRNPIIAINAWTGWDFDDKDFTYKNKALEVKFSTAKVSHLNISSERQLDSTGLDFLYLKLIIAKKVKSAGITLNAIVLQIEDLISGDLEALTEFEKRLYKTGYSKIDERDNVLSNTQYLIEEEKNYQIIEDFPLITKANFAEGIFQVNYQIELSACSDFIDPNFQLNQFIN